MQMKRYIFFGMLLTLNSLLAAQPVRSDSVEFYPNDVFYREVYMSYRRLPVNLRQVPVKNYTVSSLYYKGAAGAYRQGQTGRIQHDAGVDIRGFYTEKKVLYFGEASIYKTYIRDLAWNQSASGLVRGLMADPHYFGVAQPANWSNQQFDINGGFSVPLVNDKLDFTLEANYRVSNKFRVNRDPRVKVTDDQLKLTGILSYHVGNHGIHLGGAYEYRHDKNGTSFANKDANKASNYRTYPRWVTGYGSLVNALSDDAQSRRDETKVIIGYTSPEGHKGQLLADFSHTAGRTLTRKSNVTVYPNSAEDNIFAKYFTTTTAGHMAYFYNLTGRRTVFARLTTETFSGDNYLASKGGKTYHAGYTTATLDLATVKRSAHTIAQEGGLSFTYDASSQKDALALTSTEFSSVNAGVYVLRDVMLGKATILTPMLKAGYKQNLSASLVNGNAAYLQNVSETDYTGLATREFYEAVVYHDYRILSQNTVTASASVACRFLNTGKFRTTLKLGADGEVSTTDGASRWVSQAAVILDY